MSKLTRLCAAMALSMTAAALLADEGDDATSTAAPAAQVKTATSAPSTAPAAESDLGIYRAVVVVPATSTGPATQPAGLIAASEYAEMPAVARLTEEQKAALKEHLENRHAAEREFMTAEEALVRQMEELDEAAKAKNPEAAGELATRVAALEARFLESRKGHDAAIMKMLEPGQWVAWSGFVLSRDMVGMFERVRLTDAQKTAIRAACAEAVKDLEKPAGGETDEITAARRQLADKIEKEILTDGQREILAALPRGAASQPAGGEEK